MAGRKSICNMQRLHTTRKLSARAISAVLLTLLGHAIQGFPWSGAALPSLLPAASQALPSLVALSILLPGTPVVELEFRRPTVLDSTLPQTMSGRFPVPLAPSMLMPNIATTGH